MVSIDILVGGKGREEKSSIIWSNLQVIKQSRELSCGSEINETIFTLDSAVLMYCTLRNRISLPIVKKKTDY